MDGMVGLAGKVFILLALWAAPGCGGSVSSAGDAPDAATLRSDSAPDAVPGETGSERDSAAGDSALADSAATSDSGATDTGITSEAGSEVPLYHRPDDSQCMAPAPPGQCVGGQGQGQDTCSADSQCTSGTNGRCNNDGPLPGCSCTYDACSGDTDCPTGQLCACHGAEYSEGDGNRCIQGNCRVDADCGVHGYCSPSTSSSSCGGVVGYYCHTASDACVNDTDCTSTNVDACEWSADDGRWECLMEGLCG